MTKTVSLPARQTGKTLARETQLDFMVLAKLFEAGGALPFARLAEGFPATRPELLAALARQYRLGNVKRHQQGEPITLTASARIAVGAGRAVPPLYVMEIPAPEEAAEKRQQLADALARQNLRPCSIPISPAAVKAATEAPRVHFPVPSDDFLHDNDRSREAAIRRATRLLARRICEVHPERFARSWAGRSRL